jgi:hypothetical protein
MQNARRPKAPGADRERGLSCCTAFPACQVTLNEVRAISPDCARLRRKANKQHLTGGSAGLYMVYPRPVVPPSPAEDDARTLPLSRKLEGLPSSARRRTIGDARIACRS